MSEHTPDDYVTLNLDELENDDPNADKPPFAFVVNGERFMLTNPSLLDWKQLLEIDDPIAFFRYCMPADEKDRFKQQDVPGWKLGKIIEKFQTYYGIGDKGNGAASRI
jgi:hypothetical protein